MDENFDEKISYQELAQHIKTLGFELQGDDAKATTKVLQFVWRDKALETVIKAVNQHLDKKPFEEYFKKFDGDHDSYLTPSEFRESLLTIKESQLKPFQLERILHVLVEEKKATPLISIDKVSKFLKNYNYIDKGEDAVLIDEDLFVYIVEKFDGFSRLVDEVDLLEDKASYIQRHTFELNFRGMNLLAN